MRTNIFHAAYPFLLLTALLTVACAGKRPAANNEENPPEVMGPVIPEHHVDEQTVPSEDYGPSVPAGGVATGTAVETATATATSTTTATDTATATSGSAKLCIVLGPGMAKAMAESSVLAAIKKAKIPVHCVVGTEMGAVVGAFYAAANGSVNNLQWQLFKINKDNYFNFPMLTLREPRSSGKKFHEFLEAFFKDKKIEDLPIAFGTTAVDDERDGVVDFNRGNLADALSASSAVTGIFDAWKVNNDTFHSAAVSDPAPIELARKLGGNFIVLVDVLLDGSANSKSRFHRAFSAARSLMKLQKKDANFVIQINAGAIPFDDFSRQGEILAAGTAAADKSLPELKAAWEKFSAGQR